MAFLVHDKYERTDASVPYYLNAFPEVRQAFLEWLHGTSVKLTVDNSDPLVQLCVAEYATEADADTAVASLHSVLPSFITDRDAYCAANGITTSRWTETV